MEKYMTRKIWLTGSRRTIERMVYKDGNKCFVKWNGKMIEVTCSGNDITHWYTVEEY